MNRILLAIAVAMGCGAPLPVAADWVDKSGIWHASAPANSSGAKKKETAGLEGTKTVAKKAPNRIRQARTAAVTPRYHMRSDGFGGYIFIPR